MIDRANHEAFGRIVNGKPVLLSVRPAREVMSNMAERTVLHAGPALPAGHQIASALRQTIVGAALYEGWAETAAEAERLLDGGELDIQPAHERDALGTYCGGISPSTPVMVVENTSAGTRAYNNLNEGRGKALRYGVHDREVLERLRWLERVLAPILREALQRAGGVDLSPLIADALQMGDEGHSRHKAASSLFANQLSPHLVACNRPGSELTDVLRFLARNESFFLNVAMAAAKSVLLAVSGTPGSSLVTAMIRNGVEFGISVAAFRNRWFTAPVAPVRGCFFEGYSDKDVNSDIGDSAICESLGLGAFSLAAAPALDRYLGITRSQAEQFTLEMYRIVHGQHPVFTIPQLDYRGVPTGIDVRKVVTTGVTPITNSGLAHRDGTTGQIGFGYVRTPLACYEQALAAVRLEDA
jgi:hypothetical protein